MTDQQMLNTLCEKTAELSINASPQQHILMQKWVRLLRQWNEKYNLSANHSADDILADLVIDSLYALSHLRGERIVDVGSGAGVPGIPLAIYCPDQHFTLVDSVGKKARFMEHCRISLGIGNISVEHLRVEALLPQKPFSTIISRAFSPLSDFVRASYHLGDNTSLWLTFKNAQVAQEIEAMKQRAGEGMDWSIQSHDYPSHAKTRKLITATLSQ